MTQGVYAITCKTTGKTYIGGSVNIEQRLKQHANELRKRVHINPILQAAWDEYGEDDFTFAIIEEVGTSDELREMEQYHMDLRDNNGYNVLTKSGFRRDGVTDPSQEYITLSDAAEMLGIPKRELLRIINEESLPTYENVLDKRQTLLERSQILAMKTNPIQRKKPKEAIKKQSEAIQ